MTRTRIRPALISLCVLLASCGAATTPTAVSSNAASSDSSSETPLYNLSPEGTAALTLFDTHQTPTLRQNFYVDNVAQFFPAARDQQPSSTPVRNTGDWALNTFLGVNHVPGLKLLSIHAFVLDKALPAADLYQACSQQIDSTFDCGRQLAIATHASLERHPNGWLLVLARLDNNVTLSPH